MQQQQQRQQPGKQAEATLLKPPSSDVEGGAKAMPESNTPVSSDGKRWKGEWLKKWVLILRACGLLVSFLSFILMVCVTDFHLYGELSYVLGIAIVATVYSTVQVGIKGHELRTNTYVIPPQVAFWIDFCGDQLLSYMLFSSATAGAVLSIALRTELYTNTGLELVAASVSMSVFAFVFLAPSALFSAYCLFANL